MTGSYKGKGKKVKLKKISDNFGGKINWNGSKQAVLLS